MDFNDQVDWDEIASNRAEFEGEYRLEAEAETEAEERFARMPWLRAGWDD